MVLTTEQHEWVIQGLALEIESNRQVSEHDYTSQQSHRNVMNFLSGLLLAASFGNQHESEPISPQTISG